MKPLLKTGLAGTGPLNSVHPAPILDTAPSTLKPNQLELLLCGNTLHLAVGEDQSAILFYDASGQVRAILPDGSRDTGEWRQKSVDSYCIDWVRGPKNSCTTLHCTPGHIRLVGSDGKPRGRVTRIVPGEDAALVA